MGLHKITYEHSASLLPLVQFYSRSHPTKPQQRTITQPHQPSPLLLTKHPTRNIPKASADEHSPRSGLIVDQEWCDYNLNIEAIIMAEGRL